jgi:hypothetical protein
MFAPELPVEKLPAVRCGTEMCLMLGRGPQHSHLTIIAPTVCATEPISRLLTIIIGETAFFSAGWLYEVKHGRGHKDVSVVMGDGIRATIIS